MNKQIKLDGKIAIHYKDNPNIINNTVKLFKDVKCLHCLGSRFSNSHDVPFNTGKKFYLLNKHGWGWCEDHIKELEEYKNEKITGGE